MSAPTGYRYVRSVFSGRWELKEGTQGEVYAGNAALVVLAATGQLPLEACRLIACVVTPIAVAVPLGLWANEHFPEHGGFLGAIAGIVLGLSIGWVLARLIATVLGAAIVGFVLYIIYQVFWVSAPSKPAEVAQVLSAEVPAPVRAPPEVLVAAPALRPAPAAPTAPVALTEVPPTVVQAVAPEPESSASTPAPSAAKVMPVDPAPGTAPSHEDVPASEKPLPPL